MVGTTVYTECIDLGRCAHVVMSGGPGRAPVPTSLYAYIHIHT